MSNPEPPTMRGSSNSARMPASLTSLHSPRKGAPPATKSTWKPVAMRGSRYTNLRILSKSPLPVGPPQERGERLSQFDLSYVSARNPDFFKEFKLVWKSTPGRLYRSTPCEVFAPYWMNDTVSVTSKTETRGSE
jgi:hypothetical protein